MSAREAWIVCYPPGNLIMISNQPGETADAKNIHVSIDPDAGTVEVMKPAGMVNAFKPKVQPFPWKDLTARAKAYNEKAAEDIFPAGDAALGNDAEACGKAASASPTTPDDGLRDRVALDVFVKLVEKYPCSEVPPHIHAQRIRITTESAFLYADEFMRQRKKGTTS